MSYDNWKQATPDSYDYEENNVCKNCSEEIQDDENYCSEFCYEEYNL